MEAVEYMKSEFIEINDISIQVYSLNTVIVGSGAAAFNAADRLYTYGQKDIAIVTEGILMGTSRNTGSDKQTYYKLTLCGEAQDSVYDMSKTLFDGGSMDGDLALVEATLSAQCFYRLSDIGVPFPHNRYGEFVGYKTDHDPRQRATSAGPLTSRYMTEKLEEQVRIKGINIFDGYQVIGILVDKDKNKTLGLLALNKNHLEDINNRYVIFNCTNIVYAVGGPAGMYDASVYPESQTGASGIAFEAGVMGQNLTESQYGIASVKFRWNLSGTYQQVLPRYVSTAQDGGDEKEFLEEYFQTPGAMLDAIFLKGYQWPFDPRKAGNFGSSLIDILVYNERVIKGRRVFLDYTQNPSARSTEESELDFSLLGKESYNYLANSQALFGTPFQRLAHMNQPAIDLYKANGIDLAKEYLEIAVCAQHNNGGLQGNIWWESNIRHFFPVGEVNGSHGVYRPGGSALNSGQVGSTRAARFISARYTEDPVKLDELLQCCREQLEKKLVLSEGFVKTIGDISNVTNLRKEIGVRMSHGGAHIRSLKEAERGAKEAAEVLRNIVGLTKISNVCELPYAIANFDLLLTQYVYLSAITDYIENKGKSRGSYIVCSKEGVLPTEKLSDTFKFVLDDGKLSKKIQRVRYEDGNCEFSWMDVKPIPTEDNWFENVWNDFRKDDIIR